MAAVISSIVSLAIPWIGAFWLGYRERDLVAPAIVLACIHSAIVAATIGWCVKSTEGRRVCAELGLLVPVFLLAIAVIFGLAVVELMKSKSDTQLLPIGLALLTALLGTMSRRAPRNRFLGFRSPRTLRSDSAWRQANLRHGRRLQIASVPALAGIGFGTYGTLIALTPAVVVGLLFLLEEWRTGRDGGEPFSN